MKVIEGIEDAKKVLARQPSADLYAASPALKERIKGVFGRELEPEQAVRQIIDDVRQRGDAALFEYMEKIDHVKLTSLKVDRQQVENAYREIDPTLLPALKLAAERIHSFHIAQREKISSGTTKEGTGWLVQPLQRVGIYVPGGTASYPSTVLMTAIPARVAGVKEIILVTPPGPGGAVPGATLVAADIAGVNRIFCLGGAQAIAALAFGTEAVPKVDKICGPGNIFVVLAKKLVFGEVGIDSLPGPSEVLIIADKGADPAYCAADLLAQAEHDPMASAILVTTSRQLAEEVNREVERQLQELPRREIAAESLENKGLLIIVDRPEDTVELANLYAPEHLCLMVDNASDYAKRIINAGCIIGGEKATVVLGDYIAGPSHVLPTSGTARFSSPLNITDFIKFIDRIDVDQASLKELGEAAITIARAEGLEAHARAIEKRLED